MTRLLVLRTGLVLSATLCAALPACSRNSTGPSPPPPPRKTRVPGQFEVAQVIYDDKWGKGWEDWGWGPHDIKEGHPARISFAGYGGIILHHEELPPRFGGVSFRYRAAADYGNFLEVSLQYRQVDEHVLPPIAIGPEQTAELPGGWNEVLVPWNALNPLGSAFDRVQIRARKLVPADLVSVDHVVLTAAKGEASASEETITASVAIACDEPTKPINPMIYGMAAESWAFNAPARRMGGNPTSRWNWDGGFWNTGSDWFFENVAVKESPYQQVDNDVAHGVKTAVVVPILGWVAKDATSSGFPVSKYGPQQAADSYRSDAGNGVRVDGTKIMSARPEQTSMPAPPELIQRWVQKMREGDRHRVDMYILDNEPQLWSSTHRDVHPAPVSYDELLDRTIRYGTAIRRADPDALIAGPAEWGWMGYFYSAKDLAEGLPEHSDQKAHGGVPLLPWYLQKLAQHEKRTGVRVLDVVDVHFYPQAAQVWGNNAQTDRATSALRLRSTRALWDPEYVDESWIHEPVGLIPRLKSWIAENYPGRGISIGEWNFGAEDHISGGLAVAEVLGRFGQQGITSAFYWVGPPPGSPAAAAFLAYRNYDGKGARFLDFSVPTKEAPNVSLFASRDATGTHVTAILLNLDPDVAVQADVDVSRCGSVLSQRAFVYKEGAKALVEEAVKSDPKRVTEHLEPYSMKVVELNVAKASR